MSYAPGSRFPKSLVALEAPEDVVTMDDIITSGEVTPAVLQSLKTRQGPPASTPPLAR
jgi:amidase